MQQRLGRVCGALTLVLTLVLPAMTAGAATGSRPSTTKPTLVRAAAKRHVAATPTHSRRRRGHRAPPAGGVYARSAILIDPANGEILFEKNSERQVPVASLTKLMTALVFLEQKPDLDRDVEVTPAEIGGGGHTQLRHGEHVSLGDLLHMSLMSSDNVATRVLARESRLSPEDFVARMNKKAAELELGGTRFVEFTGLDERNVSTAGDIARLLHAAAHDERIQEITTTRAYEFRSETRAHAVHNTNRLLYGSYDILGGKTGFILEAGYCFATWVHSQGRDLIAVVLGAPTNATRFADAVRLIKKADSPVPATARM